MIDEIDYFARRDQHNKKKKDSGWGDLKKQKSEQDAKTQPENPKKAKKTPAKKKETPE